MTPGQVDHVPVVILVVSEALVPDWGRKQQGIDVAEERVACAERQLMQNIGRTAEEFLTVTDIGKIARSARIEGSFVVNSLVDNHKIGTQTR